MTTKKAPRPLRKSEAHYDAADKRRIAKPPLILGVGPARLVVIKPADFSKVDVDRRYQRDRINERVNMFINVLRNGGTIPAVYLAKYLFTEIGIDNTKLWLIDGQQRFMAHMEVERPMPALLYDVSSLNAAKEFFLASQNVNPVSGNEQVRVSSSLLATMIRDAAADPGNPIFGKVSLTAGTRCRISAGSLARACLTLAVAGTGVTGRAGIRGGIRGIQGALSRADASLERDRGARERVEAFLRLVGMAFADTMPGLVLGTLAKVAQVRWTSGPISLPSEAVAKRLGSGRVWDGVVLTDRFQPIIRQEIEKVWK